MKRWYAVHTHPRAEASAAHNLNRQGFVTFLPEYQRRRRHARRVELVRAPLFPRYLFIELDLDEQPWRAIASTIGVSNFVCLGDRPAQVPSGVVEEIQARRGDDGLVALKPVSHFKPGQAVHVLDGVFADQTGLFETIADDGRVILLLNMLGRRVKVGVPLASLAA